MLTDPPRIAAGRWVKGFGGFTAWGLGIYSLGFWGCGVLGVRDLGLGFRVCGLGFRGIGFRIGSGSEDLKPGCKKYEQALFPQFTILSRIYC